MIMLNNPPPRVIHIKIGNMKMREFHLLITRVWDDVCTMSEDFKLVRVYSNKIEGID